MARLFAVSFVLSAGAAFEGRSLELKPPAVAFAPLFPRLGWYAPVSRHPVSGGRLGPRTAPVWRMAAAEEAGLSGRGIDREEAVVRKVLSPITGRAIRVNGPAFQKVLELGYILHNGELMHKNQRDGASNGKAVPARKRPPQPGGATVARSAGGAARVRVRKGGLGAREKVGRGAGKSGARERKTAAEGLAGGNVTEHSQSEQHAWVGSVVPGPSKKVAIAVDEAEDAMWWEDGATPGRIPTEQLLAIFQEMRDGKGEVNLVQLRTALLAVQVNMPTPLLWDLLNLADESGMVQLDYNEFVHLLRMCSGGAARASGGRVTWEDGPGGPRSPRSSLPQAPTRTTYSRLRSPFARSPRT